MRFSNPLLSLILVALTVVAGLVIRQMRNASRLRDDRGAVVARCAELERPRCASGNGDIAVAPPSDPDNAVREPAAAATRTEPIGAARTVEPGTLLSDPSLQSLLLERERGRVAALYAAFARMRQLTAAQIGALHELILEREERRMDLADVVYVERLSPNDSVIRRMGRWIDDDFRGKLSRVLDEEGMRALAGHERMLQVWSLINSFAGAVALEGHPLAPEQATSLAQVVADACPDYQRGGTADLDQVDWPLALASASQVLDPAQAGAFLNAAPRYPAGNPAASMPFLADP